MPFLSCKFFALQKTYGILVAGIHAGQTALFPQNPLLFFVMLNYTDTAVILSFKQMIFQPQKPVKLGII
jgi:hypothetical protein